MVLGAAGRMGQMHARHLMELGHEVYGIDEKPCPPGITTGRWASLTSEMRGNEFDGVVIATPADRHHTDLMWAVRSNVPVFIEKPICLIPHLPDARRAVQTAMEKRLVVAVGYNLRFHPLVRQVRKLITTKLLEPQFAVFQMRQAPSRPLGYFLEEWASHEVDLAVHLLGRWTNSNLISNRKVPVHELQLSVHHAPSFCTSLILADAYTAPPVRSFSIVDRSGTALTYDIEKDHVKLEHYRTELEEWVRRIRLVDAGEYLPDWQFDGSPLATGTDGLAVIELLQRMTVKNGVRKSAIERSPPGI